MTIMRLCDSAMDKCGLSNACLMSSVLISQSLMNRGIPNQVVAGYLTFVGVYSIRHVWVHIHPNPKKTCTTNFVVDLLSLTSVADMKPSYNPVLPEGTDLLDNDDDNKEESALLESAINRTSTLVGSTVCIVDYETVIEEVSKRQPLWKKIQAMLV